MSMAWIGSIVAVGALTTSVVQGERQRKARAEREMEMAEANEAQAKAEGERARAAFSELLDELRAVEQEEVEPK